MRAALLISLFAASLRAATFYVTVAGLGGDPDYEKTFRAWAADIDKSLRAADPSAQIATLSGPTATKARLQETLSSLARQCKPDDRLVVMLIGHGSFDGLEYKMNLPGPDLTATDLAAWLNRIPAQRQLIVNMTSSSGASLPALARPGRIVITATRNGNEKNATVFPRYWLDALRDPTADTDKNDALSALEAFRYAQDKTTRFYETEKRLATEHSQLQDSGRGEAVAKPSPESGQGLAASQFTLLARNAGDARSSDPARAALLKRKQDLENRIDALKYRKAALPENEYRSQLAALLVELAKTQAELDK